MASSAQLNSVEGDADECAFPKELEGADVLTISVVSQLLDLRARQNEEDEEMPPLSQVFEKSRAYCAKFGKFQNIYAINLITSLLKQKSDILNKHEKTSLANLCPETVEEAKSLIPSLEGKIDDDELKDLLDSIQNCLRFQN